MLTGYISNGNDLSEIFMPYTSGTQAEQTGYKISNGSDISTIFQKWDGISTQSTDTNYISSNNLDLNQIFQNIYQIIKYNPFSGSTTETGFTYYIITHSCKITFSQEINGVNILAIGAGGGGGYGTGWNGGGAGGTIWYPGTSFTINFNYPIEINIGQGGQGGNQTQINGSSGGDTTVTINNNTVIALGGGGGNGTTTTTQIGIGGTNSNIIQSGTGGDHNNIYTNVQSGSGVYSGDGQNGSTYTFNDGTGTTFMFGGGGAGGGSGSSIFMVSNPYLGGGGTIQSPFTNETGGCGGNGVGAFSGFIPNGESGWNYIFNNSVYTIGSGGGAGGNNYYSIPSNGGNGNNGICIIYFPTPS